MQDHINQQVMLLYEAHHRDVYHFLLYFTGNRNDAEDLTQEVFIRVMKSWERFDYRSDQKTWLFAIAKYAAIDHYRKKKVQSFFSANWLLRLATTEGLPEKEIESKEEEQELARAIQSLSSHYRMVVILRGIKGYSVKETAEILECSESQVKVSLHRALKKLQKELHGRIGGEWYNGLAK
ncbi:UNVERIFIED_CONTAM: RNA polymerase sigma-70 factor (ECF subfamily) [Brevibacillus sp. OAP136]